MKSLFKIPWGGRGYVTKHAESSVRGTALQLSQPVTACIRGTATDPTLKFLVPKVWAGLRAHPMLTHSSACPDSDGPGGCEILRAEATPAHWVSAQSKSVCVAGARCLLCGREPRHPGEAEGQ